MRLHQLPVFVRQDTFRVVVESPRGASVKLKFGTELGVMSLSRPLTLGQGRGRERNDRIIAVPLEAPRMTHVRTARDLPARVRRELELFIVQVTTLEDKDVRVIGWAGPRTALQLIRRSVTPS